MESNLFFFYHVKELQNAANPTTTVPITKSTLLRLDSSVGGVWFFEASLIVELAVNNNKQQLIQKNNVIKIVKLELRQN